MGGGLSGRAGHRPLSWGREAATSSGPVAHRTDRGRKQSLGAGEGQDQDGSRPSLLDPIRLTEEEDRDVRKPPVGIR